MTTLTDNLCDRCGTNAAYRDGLCYGCLADVEHKPEFRATAAELGGGTPPIRIPVTIPRGDFAVAITHNDIHNAAVQIRAAMVEADPASDADLPTLAQIEAATRDAFIDLVDYAATNAAGLALENYQGVAPFKFRHSFESSLAWTTRTQTAVRA